MENIRTNTSPEPLTVSLPEAAALVGEHSETLRIKLIATDEITYRRSNGNVKGSRVHINYQELKVYANGGLEALREYRFKKGLTKEKGKKDESETVSD